MKTKLFVLFALPLMAMFFMGAAQVANPGCSCDAHGQTNNHPTMSALSLTNK